MFSLPWQQCQGTFNSCTELYDEIVFDLRMMLSFTGHVFVIADVAVNHSYHTRLYRNGFPNVSLSTVELVNDGVNAEML